jgi:hypothetical protein
LRCIMGMGVITILVFMMLIMRYVQVFGVGRERADFGIEG